MGTVHAPLRILLPDGERLEVDADTSCFRALRDTICARRRPDWPSHLFTGFLVGGSSQWLPLDRRVMEHSIGQPVIMWASRPRLADKLPVPGHYAHCTYFSLPSTCWTARGYAATGLDLGVFHPSAEGVVESCCSSFSTCLDWIIATTQRESPLFATAMTLRHQKQSEREIREAVRQCLEVRDRIMTGGDSTMTTSTEHAMAEAADRNGKKKSKKKKKHKKCKQQQQSDMSDDDVSVTAVDPRNRRRQRDFEARQVSKRRRTSLADFQACHTSYPVTREFMSTLGLSGVETVVYLDLDPRQLVLTTTDPLPPSMLLLGFYRDWVACECDATPEIVDHIQRRRLFLLNLPRVRKPGKDGVLQAVMTSLAYYERTLSKPRPALHLLVGPYEGYRITTRQMRMSGFHVAHIDACSTLDRLLTETRTLRAAHRKAVTAGESAKEGGEGQQTWAMGDTREQQREGEARAVRPSRTTTAVEARYAR